MALSQIYLDEKCDAFFRLPMPERLYCFYDGSGVNDVFVFENLLSEGFVNFRNEDYDDQVCRQLLCAKTIELEQVKA